MNREKPSSCPPSLTSFKVVVVYEGCHAMLYVTPLRKRCARSVGKKHLEKGSTGKILSSNNDCLIDDQISQSK